MRMRHAGGLAGALVLVAAAGIVPPHAASGSTAVTAATTAFTPALPLLDAGGANTLAAEPGIHVDPEGRVFVTGPVGIPTGGCPLWRIHPGTLNSLNSAYDYLGRFDTDHDGAGGGDCDITSGGLLGAGGADNLAVSSLSLANLTSNQSSDHGDSFRTPANSAAVQSTGVDRQWNAADTALGQVYMTVHDGASNILVSSSTDGGYTYRTNSNAIDPVHMATATHNNHFGTIVVNPANHRLYIAYVAPSASGPTNPQNAVYIAEGDPCAVLCTPGAPLPAITWTDHLVYSADPTTSLAHDFPAIAIDASGAVYVGWSDTHHVYVAHSATPGRDGSWSAPARADSSGEHSAMFPWLVAGRSGAVDAVFYGAQLGTAGAACPAGATGGNDDSNGVNNNCNNVWTVRFAQSLDGGSTFGDIAATGVNHLGSICDLGLSCNVIGGDRSLLDYFEVALDPQGAANIAFTQDHTQVAYTRQCTGVSATTGGALALSCASLQPPPPVAPAPQCSGAHVVTDPAGDAANPSGAGGDTSTADIIDMSLSNDATARTVTTTITLANLSTTTPMLGTTFTTYYAVWTGPDGKEYATSASLPDPSGKFTFLYGPFDPSTNQLASATATSGTVTAGPDGTISVTAPYSGVGGPTIPVAPGATPAVRAPYALTFAGEGPFGSGTVFTRPADRGPNVGEGAAWSVC